MFKPRLRHLLEALYQMGRQVFGVKCLFKNRTLFSWLLLEACFEVSRATAKCSFVPVNIIFPTWGFSPLALQLCLQCCFFVPRAHSRPIADLLALLEWNELPRPKVLTAMHPSITRTLHPWLITERGEANLTHMPSHTIMLKVLLVRQQMSASSL